MNSKKLEGLQSDRNDLRKDRGRRRWWRALAAVAAGAGSTLPAGDASAQIKFQHHYISTTFPRLSGFGQSTVGDFNNDGRLDFLMGQHFGTNEKRQYLFLNNGTPENWPFHLVTTDNTGDGGTNALDIDGDGWLDIVSSARSTPSTDRSSSGLPKNSKTRLARSLRNPVSSSSRCSAFLPSTPLD